MTIETEHLDFFHPQTAEWFSGNFGCPTEIQALAWPRIAAGRHVLLTAPTGSGKTLTAFLWALDRLLTGAWACGKTRVLYISPLKALNADIHRNLQAPLEGIERRFRERGKDCPSIRILTRSGDTPQSERRHMLRHPPEILITTPESLNLLLSSRNGRNLLRDLQTVILDEIHTVVGNKRGTHLITAVDRLVPLSGEFQRIAISATVRPMTAVAEFVGGFQKSGSPSNPDYFPRPVDQVRAKARKVYDLQVRFAEPGSGTRESDEYWDPPLREFRRIILENTSTLFFTRSRRKSESLTLRINSDPNQGPLAYSHHGSLARELRRSVENKLKSGELRAIVATSSLELGIDIGTLSEVVLVQPPLSISSTVQRIGRSGHRVGETAKGTFLPAHDPDIIEAAVLARAVHEGDIESLHPIEGALDVLAQVLISMTAVETWDIDQLYHTIRSCWPYRRLTRRQFDLVLDMLGGRYADTRIRELKPHVSIDRIDNTASARPGARLSLYFSGGTIPDRGYYNLRHAGSGALIGDLDEEFVWEAKIGQKFNFGAQQWKIRRITHNDVFAEIIPRKSMETPFWRAEAFDRDFHFSSRIGEFLEHAENNIDNPCWSAELQRTHFLDQPAAERLIKGLITQRKQTGRPLPHRRHVLVEHIRTGPGGAPGNQIVIHTFWGGRVNRPFALAMESAWEEEFGLPVEVFPGNDGIALLLPHDIPARDLLSLVTADKMERLLRVSLENSGFFGARFRENAGRALLITRKKPGERVPLWMLRLRSQKLFQAVRGRSDFPIILETWRSCLNDEFDMEGLSRVLKELETGVIQIGECFTHAPSLMASNFTWAQINTYMYAGDTARSEKPTALREDLLQEAVFTPGLRPTVPSVIIQDFEARRQRLFPGYSPGSSRELVDWIMERVWLPDQEWDRLVNAMRRDLLSVRPESPSPANAESAPSVELARILREAESKLMRVVHPGSGRTLVAALEREAEAGEVLETNIHTGSEESDARLTSRLGEWLSFYGPIEPDRIRKSLGIDPGRLDRALHDLQENDLVIRGRLITDDSRDLVCDADNFETLLRMARAAAAPRIRTRPVRDLPLFLADFQGLTSQQPNSTRKAADASLPEALERLAVLPLSARLWESEILPARVPGYSLDGLDALLRGGGVGWNGASSGRIFFTCEGDRELLEDQALAPPAAFESLQNLFLDPDARYEFETLARRSGWEAARLEEALWKAVWAGRISHDTFSAVRRGLLTRFHLAGRRTVRHLPPPRPHRRSRRSIGHRSRPLYPGGWRLLAPTGGNEPDPLEREELGKDRVRLLLDRYGILFRELLERESTEFRWPRIFRSLRLMELSGEILSGYFFEGIPGPQFISRRALARLKTDLPENAVYWMSAVDPASPCGLGLKGLRAGLPRRVEGHHLVFRGARLILVSLRRGRNLEIRIPPDDPDIERSFAPLHHLLNREFSPLKRIIVEAVNGTDPVSGPYLPVLESAFDTIRDLRGLSLYPRGP